MRLKLPKHVHGFVDRHDVARYYLRRPGFKAIPLPGPAFSAPFMAAYQAAMEDATTLPRVIGAVRTKPGSIRQLVVSYLQSTAFANLAPLTQAKRRAVLERFSLKHGEKHVATLRSEHMAQLLSKLSGHNQKTWRATLRGMFEHGVSIGLAKIDPTQGFRCARVKIKGFHSWSEDDIARFEAVHPLGSTARTAFGLMLYTCARPGDVIRLGPQHFRDGKFLQRKTGDNAGIAADDDGVPIHPELRRILDAAPRENLTWLFTEHGRPFSGSNSFGNSMRQWCDEADLPMCTAHGLRKACMRRMAEAEVPILSMMAVSGHRDVRVAAYYAREADKTKLARGAMKQMAAAFPGQKANKDSQTNPARFAKMGKKPKQIKTGNLG